MGGVVCGVVGSVLRAQSLSETGYGKGCFANISIVKNQILLWISESVEGISLLLCCFCRLADRYRY